MFFSECSPRGDLGVLPPAPHSLCSAAPKLLLWSVVDAPNIGFMIYALDVSCHGLFIEAGPWVSRKGTGRQEDSWVWDHWLVSKGETPKQTHCYFGPSIGFVLVFLLLFLRAHSWLWGILVLTSSLQRRGLTHTKIAAWFPFLPSPFFLLKSRTTSKAQMCWCQMPHSYC